ncbi:hypothetical protein BV25DRAFT_547220 [Artomyces pyxidatus]|uniref:Uncharacterized protein n=1 Tax=Artomyces pyxidatus TaxID=48021 RepID=A0ACB8TIQ3_9AGAM|nr:hypothetical protein BV25DRAFT_547220 [Artomyces pyxidatus]
MHCSRRGLGTALHLFSAFSSLKHASIQAEIITSLRENVTSTRDKYRALKQTTRSLRDQLDAAQLSSVTPPKTLSRGTQTTDEEKNIDSRLQEFLESRPTPPEHHPEFTTITPYGSYDGALPPSHLGTPNTIFLREQDTIFPDNIITHGVLIAPSHRFNPKQNGGQGMWEVHRVCSASVAEIRDLHYGMWHDWAYFGAYRIVFRETVELRDLQSFNGSAYLPSLCKKAGKFPELLHPHSSLNRFNPCSRLVFLGIRLSASSAFLMIENSAHRFGFPA